MRGSISAAYIRLNYKGEEALKMLHIRNGYNSLDRSIAPVKDVVCGDSVQKGFVMID